MKTWGVVLAVVTVFVGGLRATELAPGLVYLRPGTEIALQTGSVVVDLRQAKDDNAARTLLAALEPGNTNPRRIILALVSPETPAGLRRQVSDLPRSLTIGRAATDFETDIAVSTSAEADRRAVDALVAGTPPGQLVVENAGKTRYDESSLIREYTTGPAPAKDPDHASAKPAEPAEAAVVDAVLQTALHIYRGLIVLKKI